MNREEREALAFCERCAKRAGCTLYLDERLRDLEKRLKSVKQQLDHADNNS